jgi:hypothetical protein
VNKVIDCGADARKSVQLANEDAIAKCCWKVAMEAGVIDLGRWKPVLRVRDCDLEGLGSVGD